VADPPSSQRCPSGIEKEAFVIEFVRGDLEALAAKLQEKFYGEGVALDGVGAEAFFTDQVLGEEASEVTAEGAARGDEGASGSRHGILLSELDLGFVVEVEASCDRPPGRQVPYHIALGLAQVEVAREVPCAGESVVSSHGPPSLGMGHVGLRDSGRKIGLVEVLLDEEGIQGPQVFGAMGVVVALQLLERDEVVERGCEAALESDGFHEVGSWGHSSAT